MYASLKLLRGVSKSTSWMMCWCRQEATRRMRALMYPTSMTRNEVNDFGDLILTIDTRFRNGGHENEGLLYCRGWGFELNDFSWTYQRYWSELIALTQNKVMDGMIDQCCDNHQAEWPNTHSHSDEVKVSCSRVTCYHKVFTAFSHFPQSFMTSTSLFFIKLEEDNILLLYNFILRTNP